MNFLHQFIIAEIAHAHEGIGADGDGGCGFVGLGFGDRLGRRFAAQRDFGQTSGAKAFRGGFRQRLPALLANSQCIHIQPFALLFIPYRRNPRPR